MLIIQLIKRFRSVLNIFLFWGSIISFSLFLTSPKATVHAAENPVADSHLKRVDKGDNNVMAHSRPDIVVPIEQTSIKSNKLAIPRILKPTKSKGSESWYTIVVHKSDTIFMPGIKTSTLGYNSSYLGPTMHVQRGQIIHVHIVNELAQPTTIHWHGLVVPSSADGGPLQPIDAHTKKDISFKVDQQAATLWFHPHAMGTTAQQVYEGLAGLLIVDDKNSQTLNIPKRYGFDDVPVIVQDRNFRAGGKIDYAKDYNSDGTEGHRLLTNGTINPYLNVKTKLIRLRLLNGSNARKYMFKLSDGQEMTQIATDGGFLNKPIAERSITLAPGERAEVLVDTTMITKNHLYLMTNKKRVLDLRLANKRIGNDTIPSQLNDQSKGNDSKGKSVNMIFHGMGKMVEINGRSFDPKRIDLTTKVNLYQVWKLKNIGMMGSGMDHPFHVHGAQFRVLSINGKPAVGSDMGLHDTFNLKPDESVNILIRFPNKGRYVYHCHNLEHEENGMMGQVKVE